MNANKIQAIEDKYGLMILRMALTHLVDVGHRNLQDQVEIKATCKEIRETTSSNSILSADIQCSLIECAHELTQFSIQNLLRYVKKNFTF